MALELETVQPSLAGPKRPQDRVPLAHARDSFRKALAGYVQDYDWRDEASAESFPSSDPPADGNDAPKPNDGGPSYVGSLAGTAVGGSLGETDGDPGPTGAGAATAARAITLADGTNTELAHGHVVIAAITSCTNTSNPSVMIGAGILARNAVERGLRSKPWVKTSLAPGSKVVSEYLDRADLTEPLERLGFNLVGYGCTTCIGNSGPLAPEISQAVSDGDLAVVSVLSGNRNFEGRINPDVKMNYLASPPLCVAYALAGTMDIEILSEPLGSDPDGKEVYLRDIWPTEREIAQTIGKAIRAEMFRESYADVFAGDERWNALDAPTGELFAWDESSSYVRRPPYFEDMPALPAPVGDLAGARVLALLGDSVTTDHISPAGSIKRDSPAGLYLQELGIAPKDFNSYGSRRGNHEVMVRGTFANIRLRNQLAPGTEGGVTRYLGGRSERPRSAAEEMSIYQAAMRYMREGVPLVVIAGTEYGSGSSRDWAAKGTKLLGVRAVIAGSFERIHRSNLIGMGVLPLQFPEGESAQSLGLSGEEIFSIEGLAAGFQAGGAGDDPPREVLVRAERPPSAGGGGAGGGDAVQFKALVRIDTPREAEYFRHGGILQHVLRALLAG
jgi:aconitate hydratase